jgi:hypothetical protein
MPFQSRLIEYIVHIENSSMILFSRHHHHAVIRFHFVPSQCVFYVHMLVIILVTRHHRYHAVTGSFGGAVSVTISCIRLQCSLVLKLDSSINMVSTYKRIRMYLYVNTYTYMCIHTYEYMNLYANMLMNTNICI